MNARASYTIPLPTGLRPVSGAYEPVPFVVALGQAFSFGWRKELGKKRGHAEVSRIESLKGAPRRSTRA